MKKYLFLFFILFTPIAANAFLTRAWSYDELRDSATLIVIAVPQEVRKTSERTTFPGVTQYNPKGPPKDVIGISMEAKFEVLSVLKSHVEKKYIILHYLEPEESLSTGIPNVLSVGFDPKKKTQYLMFLTKEADGRYAPVSGFSDLRSSIKTISGAP